MATTKYEPLNSDTTSENAIYSRHSSRDWRTRTTFVLGLMAAAIMGFVVGTLASRSNLQSSMNAQGALPRKSYEESRNFCYLEQKMADLAVFAAPSGSIYVKMEYNRTFSHRPSEMSNAAWETMFPGRSLLLSKCFRLLNSHLDGDGFVRDLTISPKVSTLSVFHQLHCLVSVEMCTLLRV